MRFSPALSIAAAACTIAFAGCAAQTASSVPMTSGPSTLARSATLPSFLQTSPDVIAKRVAIGVRLNGETPFNSPTYGKVLGYFKGLKSTTSQVVTIHTGQQVVFHNVDGSFPHTAAFLGDASASGAPWPAKFNGGTTQSVAGTAIGTSMFTTGVLQPGTHSLVYTAGSPGFYMFGCFFHYNADGMRTVVIVQ